MCIVVGRMFAMGGLVCLGGINRPGCFKSLSFYLIKWTSGRMIRISF
jgi:hypothetical protein